MPKHGNHHGSPKEILGEAMRERDEGKAKILGSDGQPVSAVSDEKTYIQEFKPIKAMVLVRSRKESILITAKSNSSVCPYADVIAIGPLCVQLRVGDRVMIVGGCDYWPIPYHGCDDGSYLLIQEGNFFGVVNPRPEDPKTKVCDQTPTQFEKGEAPTEVIKRTSADEEWERRQVMAAKANKGDCSVKQSDSETGAAPVPNPATSTT